MQNNDKNTEVPQSHKTAVMASMAREERVRLIAEELMLCMGFNCVVFKDSHTWKIKLDTIAGEYIYTPSEKTIMGDVYRFISNYGSMLHYWGLESKKAEYKY